MGRSSQRGHGRAQRFPPAPIWIRPPGPQAPPSSFLRPGRFSPREGPSLGAGVGVLLEVGAGTPRGWGFSLEGYTYAGGWRGGGHPIATAGWAPTGTPNPLPANWGGGGAELMPQRVRSWGSLLGGTGGTPAPRGGRGKPFPSARSGSTPSPGKLAPRPRLRPAGSAAGPRPCRPLAPGGVGVSGPRSPPWGCDTGCLPVVWLTTQNHSTLVTERSAVPFLPVNPEYSATRNQVNPSPRPRYPPLHLAPRPLLLPPLPPSPGPAEAGQVQRQGVCHLAHRHPRGSQAPAAREESAEPHR